MAGAGSPRGRAGGPGIAGLDKSCLSAILGAVGLLEQKKGTWHKCIQCTKGGWKSRGVLAQAGSAEAWDCSTQTGHGASEALDNPHVRCQALQCGWEAGPVQKRGGEGRQKVHPPEDKEDGAWRRQALNGKGEDQGSHLPLAPCVTPPL